MALSTFLLGAVALEQAIALDATTADRRGAHAQAPPTLFRGRDFTAGLDLIIAGLKHQKETA
jgi:hypothetical protein